MLCHSVLESGWGKPRLLPLTEPLHLCRSGHRPRSLASPILLVSQIVRRNLAFLPTLPRFPMMPLFPAELCDYIIDYLHNDRKSLLACSLTCRDWVSSSRYHLFHEVVLYKPRLFDALQRLLQARPHLGPYIRVLKISKLENAGKEDLVLVDQLLPTILAFLTRVEFLGASLLSSAARILGAAPSPLSVTELSIQFCEFPTLEDFARLFYACPELCSLEFHGVCWGTAVCNLQTPVAGPRIQRLVIGRDVDYSTVVNFLLRGNHHREITSLSATVASEEDAHALSVLLENIGDSLEELAFEWLPALSGLNAVFLPTTFSIPATTALRKLSIRCVISHAYSTPWVTTLLANVNPIRLTTLALETRLLGDMDAFDWRTVESMLCAERFGCLRSVVVKVMIWSGAHMDQASVNNLIRHRLSQVHSRGILRFTS